MAIALKIKHGKNHCEICQGKLWHTPGKEPLCPSTRTQINANGKRWRLANPEKHRLQSREKVRRYTAKLGNDIVAKNARNFWLQREYGINSKDYDVILAQQNGCCAICKTSDPGKRRFAVDHDHTTRLVRGILCIRCNQGLGLLGDTIEKVQKALNYLIAHANKTNSYTTKQTDSD